MKQIIDFAKEGHEKMTQYFQLDTKSNAEFVFLAKLVEEVGELSEALLFSRSFQRVKKLKEKKVDLAQEFADVILVTAILAQEAHVDLEKALEEKMKIVSERSLS